MKYIKVPILIYFFLSLMLYWAHYPVGTYELAGDQWTIGNIWAISLKLYDFSKDHWMSHYPFKSYGSILSMHIPFYRCFNDWETYLSVLNPLYFFAGCSLLYLIALKISQSKLIAFFVSLLFSSATVWFSIGDIFALIPMYATLQRTLGYILYLGALLLFLYFPLSLTTIICLSVMTALMVWIHPVTFMGPGISSLLVISIYYLWKTNENAKRKLLAASICIGIILLIVLPYCYIFKSSLKTKVPVTLIDEEETVFLQDSISDQSYAYNPMDFSRFEIDRNVIRGYKIMLGLATALTIASLFFVRENRNIRLFASFALTCFGVTFLIRELEYLYFRDDGITIFPILMRNDKWIYFYCFLIIVASYQNFRKIITNFPHGRYSLLVLNFAFLTLILICLNGPPLVKGSTGYSPPYRPLFRTMSHNYIGMKIVQKLGLCHAIKQRGIYSKISNFCPDDRIFSILKINSDAHAATSFMFRLPDKLTFVGPNWLRYKAHRNLAYNREDGGLYLRLRDRKYLEWKESERIHNNIINDWLYTKDPEEIFEEARKIRADFLFLEKFRHGYIHAEWRYSFVKRNYDLSKLPVIYENDSFAIIDLRKESL